MQPDAGVEPARWAAAARLPERHFEAFQRLSKTLVHGPAFQLVFVDCPSGRDRKRLIDELDGVLRHAGIAVQRLPLSTRIADVSALEQRLTRAPLAGQVVHLLQASPWFTPARWEALNLLRERLAHEVSARLVFWLDGPGIKTLVLHAQDLWAWRSGVYTFDAERSPDATMGLTDWVSVNPALVVAAAGASPQSRWQRVAVLREWLAHPPPGSEELQGNALLELADLLSDLGDWVALEAHLSQLQVPFFADRGNAPALLRSRIVQARALHMCGRAAEALALCRQLEPEVGAQPDPLLAARFWSVYASVERGAGHREAALAIGLEHQIPLLSQIDHVPRLLLAHERVVADLLALRRLDEADAHFSRHLRPLLDRHDGPSDLADALLLLAELRALQGREDEALALVRDQVVPVLRDLGDAPRQAKAALQLAELLEAKGLRDDAIALLRQDVVAVHDRLGDANMAALMRWRLGRMLLATGRAEDRGEGLHLLQGAAREADRLQTPWRGTIRTELNHAFGAE